MSHIEQHVEFIIDLIESSPKRSLDRIEADPLAEQQWVAKVNEHAAATLFPEANSWYIGANIPGKLRIFMPFVGGIGVYREICDRIQAEGYVGFHRSSASAAASLPT